MVRSEMREVMKAFTIPSQIVKVTRYSKKLKKWHLVKTMVGFWNDNFLPPLSPEKFFPRKMYLELKNLSKYQFSQPCSWKFREIFGHFARAVFQILGRIFKKQLPCIIRLP